MSPLATRDGQRNAQRTTQRCGALSPCSRPDLSLSAPKSHNRTIAGDFRFDGAKSPEIPQKEEVLPMGSEIAARNRKSLATFHRTLKSQCSMIAFSCLGNRCDFWGPLWASQSQIAKKLLRFRCDKRPDNHKAWQERRQKQGETDETKDEQKRTQMITRNALCFPKPPEFMGWRFTL